MTQRKASRRFRRQSGFSIVELVITMCIGAILASVAIREMRDYSRRARVSEVILAGVDCKAAIAEGYLTIDSDNPPEAGEWGCEVADGKTTYAGAVQTSPHGVIRIAITNVDLRINGEYVYFVPATLGGAPMTTPDDLGNGVRVWLCGASNGVVRNSLPGTCRADTTIAAMDDFN